MNTNINTTEASNQEYLACFDSEQNPLKPLSRSKALAQPFPCYHAVANIFVVNEAGELLITKRSETVPANPGKWQSHIGGHVKAGSDFLQTAIEESYEEIGLSLDSSDLVAVESGKYEPHKHFFVHYAARFGGDLGRLRFMDKEISEAKWMSFESYKQYFSEHSEEGTNSCDEQTYKNILIELQKAGR